MAAMWDVPLEPSARISLKPEDRPAGGGPRGNGPEPGGQPEIAVGTDPPAVQRGVTAPPADEFPCEWWPPD